MMDTTKIIEHLVEDLNPIESSAHPKKAMTWVLTAVAFGLTPIALFFPVREDIAVVGKHLPFLLSLTIFLLVSMTCFWLTIQSSLPGKLGSAGLKSAIAVLTLVLGMSLYSGHIDYSNVHFTPHWDVHCASRILICALVPFLILATAMVRLAPLQWLPSSLFALSGSVAIGSFILQLYCRLDASSHRLIGHGVLPLLVLIATLLVSLLILTRIQRKIALKKSALNIEITHPKKSS